MSRGAVGLALRASREADLPAIQAIYAHHVRHGLASFELEVPSLAEMAERRAAVLARGLPHIVAEAEGAVLGFAYAGAYRARPAYRYSVEDSLYVAPSALRRGCGRALLARLIEDCTALGYRQMVAVIGDSANRPSIDLHAALGFRRVGRLEDIGFKFGRWVDSVLMQRALGAGGGAPPT